MPKRTDIHKVLIIGSGPIIIGQACEFDYSGTQACKALREEGFKIVLLNSNPATIMTDPEFADRTYIEPITPETIEKILARERRSGDSIDALLPTLGGQTGLNCAVRTAELGILQSYNVEMIGATREAIHKAEDRIEFKNAMQRIGLDVPRSGIAHSYEQACQVLEYVKLPCCIRPAYTLGGTGGGFAYTPEEFDFHVKRGLEYSPIHEVLIEENLVGWKEYELEVMRDKNDNVVIVCSIENFDPMGVHTGDSITVAPAQTLTDKEYQRMRDAAIAIMREIGVETGGSNIQFAVCPKTGRMVVIEMNPRVSRSSALASKATGFPIAKIAAKLAIGYTLDEIPNDITKETPACFEPTIDYCVVKIPRWTFEKFPEADETLTTQMKSVGEAMAIGRTFKEALQKGIRSMEIKRFGLGLDENDVWLQAHCSVAGQVPDSRLCERPSPAAGARGAEPARPGPLVDTRGSAGEDAMPILGRRGGEAPPDTVEQRAVDWPIPEAVLRDKLARPCQGRLYYIRYAFKMGWTVEQVHELTNIDPWFLENIRELTEFERELLRAAGMYHDLERTSENEQERTELIEILDRAKQWGYSDVQLASAFGTQPEAIRRFRERYGRTPVYKLVDTCAAEFEAYTPYYYSSYEAPAKLVPQAVGSGKGQGRSNPGPPAEPRESRDDEARITDKPKIIILGGGPNRIGQGIEFDYCCVHAAFAAKEEGFETIMINSNPETVSTDYDTSDLLFFEPLTHEDVLNIIERLNAAPLPRGQAGQGPSAAPAMPPADDRDGLVRGVIVQFGGQTPLNLAQGLKDAGAPIIGTTPESIHLAEDREQFQKILRELGLMQPPNGIAFSIDQARRIAEQIGYPVLVRPSYVLGGRAMEICNNEQDLLRYMREAVRATDRIASGTGREHPILIDKFLLDATEVDVDCVADYTPTNCGPRSAEKGRCVICGVMEHIEEAGVHSGDSACALPPYSLSPAVVDEIRRQTQLLAERLRVCGLMNVQYAVKDDQVYVLEVNPRASRTVPFVSKATGVPWAKIATKVMLGKSLDEALGERGLDDAPWPKHVSVKEAVFPFNRFPGVDIILGPEMRSTGEVMGIDRTFAMAFAKSQMGAGLSLPVEGTVFISVNEHDKPLIAPIARQLAEMGFELLVTQGTHEVLRQADIPARCIPKISEHRHPNMLDLIEARQVHLLINTPTRKGRHTDEGRLRAAATIHNVPIITTITGARAAVGAIRALREGECDVCPLQEYYG